MMMYAALDSLYLEHEDPEGHEEVGFLIVNFVLFVSL
jgi:hypothetical protein